MGQGILEENIFYVIILILPQKYATWDLKLFLVVLLALQPLRLY